MCLSAVLGVGSALIGASSSKSAAKAQEQAAGNQVALQREVFDYQKDQFAPYGEAGNNALAALQYELGLGPAPVIGGQAQAVNEFTETIPGQEGTGPGYWTGGGRDGGMQFVRNGMVPEQSRTRFRVGEQIFDAREAADEYATANPTGGTEYGGFTKTPGYDFRLQEGVDAVQASVAGQRGLNSGNALKALTRYGQDYASGEYNNYLNRLTGLTGLGQSSAAMSANAGQNFATGASNAYANAGNAQAAGAIGVGNALQGGINNFANLWGYQQGQGKGNNWLFGGNSWG